VSTPPPADVDEAIQGVLAACPEFGSAWALLCDEMDSHVPSEVGIYNFTGTVVLPFLLYALDGSIVSDREPSWHFSGADHRSGGFKSQSEWSALPDRGTPELADIVARLYDTFELWATSTSKDISNCLRIELFEGVYVDLTATDFARPAGPELRRVYSEEMRKIGLES
jgi:hypothetical protein